MATQKQSITISTDELMTVLQAAKVIGVHFATVYRWVENGKVLSLKFGGIIFIPTSEVERLKAEREKEK